MKKKLLTILAVLAMVVAMVVSVVACTPKTPVKPTPPTPTPTPDNEVDKTALISESMSSLSSTLTTTLNTALGDSDGKSYDATIFVKVKVGEGADATDVDVKLHVAGTFGTKNTGLVDVIVGGTSYVTLYATDDMVYIGEALTQEAMRWFKVDAAAGVLDAFFPQLIDIFAKVTDGKTLLQTVNGTVSSILGMLPILGGLIMNPQSETCVVKEELDDGVVKYTNTLALNQVSSLLPTLKEFGLDINEMLSSKELAPYKGIIDTVVSVIFGGSLDDLLAGTIAPEDMPVLKLSFASNTAGLTEFGISYDYAIGEGEAAKPISVAFGFEDVNITTDDDTTIVTPAITAGIAAAVEPAIKLSIGADIPGKGLAATLEAYVVPDVSIILNEYCVENELHNKVEDAQNHTHADGAYHYKKIDGVDMSSAKAYAIAKGKDGKVVNLGCAVDFSKFAEDNTLVLNIDLAGLYDILGVENTDQLPTQFKKTFKLFANDTSAEGGEPAGTPEGTPEVTPEVTPEAPVMGDNVIDNVVALVGYLIGGGKFDIGMIMGQLNPVLDFAKEILDTAVTPNIAQDETTKVVTVNAAAILKALVANTTIKGSESLKINGENNLTEYLTSLDGIAKLVDNIMRHAPGANPEAEENSLYTETKLVALIETFAGIDITDAAFNNTKLLLEGIRGNATTDNGIGFTATLQSEDKTVITLTFTADIVDATSEIEKSNIGTPENPFDGGELDGGQPSTDIITLLNAILDAYKAATPPAPAPAA